VKETNTLITISATMLVTALVLLIAFWAWLELYMVYCTVVPVSGSYHAFVPGKPSVSARLYWLWSPRIGFGEDLLVLTSKSARYPEFYWIDMGRRQIGIPESPKYIPLWGSAIVDRATLVKFPLEGELKAKWNVSKSEVRIRIMGFSDRATKPRPDDDENARRMMPIAYQREIVFKKVRSE
jgi:hypothetical protein